MTTSVLVPSSLVREADSKEEATRKLGIVARAAAVFRVDRLGIFPDPDGERRWGEGFVDAVLRYAATPPYLRKEAFGRRDELECVGVLPPLRIPSWTGSESSDSGSLREGIVTQVGPEGRVRVNCGMQHPISLRQPDGLSVAEGERVTVRVSSREPVRAKLVPEAPPGFRVERVNHATALGRPDAGLRVATSRAGKPLRIERLVTLTDRIERNGLTVSFGAPGRGLPEILGTRPETNSSDRDHPGFDTWLNTVPDQGSEVVRTEEALLATLGCLNLR
ncbi:MAG: putative RNA uridine N3 methyltransferase [Halobacteriaceae archaeon]